MKHKMRSPEIHLLRYTNSIKYLVVDMGLRPPDDNLLIGMHVDASRDVLSLAIFSFFCSLCCTSGMGVCVLPDFLFFRLFPPYERHRGGGEGGGCCQTSYFCSLVPVQLTTSRIVNPTC